MPHTRSAAKRHRQSDERNLLNKSRLTEIKTLKKRLLRQVSDGLKTDAETTYREVTKRLDQAASVNTLHKNTVARSKSRLAKAIATAKPPAARAERKVKADAPAAAKAPKAAKAATPAKAPKAKAK